MKILENLHYTLLSDLRLVKVEYSVVAMTLSPLAAVVRFSSDASRWGTWGFACGSVLV